MAAGFMPPEEGGEFSPCRKGDCKHVDCASIHRRAERVCHRCLMVIGWDVRFYDEGDAPDLTSVHALCEELAIEREQNRRRITPADL